MKTIPTNCYFKRNRANKEKYSYVYFGLCVPFYRKDPEEHPVHKGSYQVLQSLTILIILEVIFIF
jgi:hypothetical protein